MNVNNRPRVDAILPGKTSADMQGVCPSKTVKPGAFKFSILGRLSGSMINSGQTGFTNATSIFTSPTDAGYRDLAKYKTLLSSIGLKVDVDIFAGLSLFDRRAFVVPVH